MALQSREGGASASPAPSLPPSLSACAPITGLPLRGSWWGEHSTVSCQQAGGSGAKPPLLFRESCQDGQESCAKEGLHFSEPEPQAAVGLGAHLGSQCSQVERGGPVLVGLL